MDLRTVSSMTWVISIADGLFGGRFHTFTAQSTTLTLMMANRFVGDALAALPGQDSLWWRNYWRADDSIKFDTPAWVILIAAARPLATQPHVGPRQERAPQHLRERVQPMPDDVRAAIP